jgi:NAD+ synthase (glutamine-hydrolysing)
VKRHFRGHRPRFRRPQRDVTYENCQASERTQVHHGHRQSAENALVVGTGDMSELALGWATYNGDHMSMYGVNSGVPKTLVRYVIGWYARHPAGQRRSSPPCYRDILATPVSPELLPAEKNGEISQKTEDLVGPYELHDFLPLLSWSALGLLRRKRCYRAGEIRLCRAVRRTRRSKKWLRTFVPPLLRPAVQAFLPARRAQGRHRCASRPGATGACRPTPRPPFGWRSWTSYKN